VLLYTTAAAPSKLEEEIGGRMKLEKRVHTAFQHHHNFSHCIKVEL
jgi:hypothetical protein